MKKKLADKTPKVLWMIKSNVVLILKHSAHPYAFVYTKIY